MLKWGWSACVLASFRNHSNTCRQPPYAKSPIHTKIRLLTTIVWPQIKTSILCNLSTGSGTKEEICQCRAGARERQLGRGMENSSGEAQAHEDVEG